MQAVGIKLRRRREPGTQRSDRSHHNIDLLVPEPPECGRTRLLDIRMRCQAGIWIRLPGRERAYPVVSTGVKFAMKISDIGRERLYTPVLRREDDEGPAQ